MLRNDHFSAGTRVLSLICVVMLCATIGHDTTFAQQRDTLWIEDWEGDWTRNWHVDAGTWQVGPPTSGPDSAYSQENCAATVLDGNYAEPVDSRLIRDTAFLVPPDSTNPRLRLWHWYSFSAGDFGEVHIKVVGTTKWDTILTRYADTGSGVWTYPSIDLSEYENLWVQIAFNFHSHQVGPYPNVSTGWYIDDVAVITGPLVFNNPENFEDGIGDWAAERGTWEVGIPTAGPDSAFSPPMCVGTVLGGNYAEPVGSRFISARCKVAPPDSNPAFSFWHWYSFSSGDFGRVEIRVGKGSWQHLAGPFEGSSSNAWSLYRAPLSDYADSTVQFAFSFHSHQVGPYPNVSTGWYIDSIMVEPECSTGVDDLPGSVPLNFELSQNFPNPFNPGTTIRYQLPAPGTVKITIFNNLGQKVRTLVDELRPAGDHEVAWNGAGDEGEQAPSGVYVYRMEAGGFVEMRKMVLLR